MADEQQIWNKLTMSLKELYAEYEYRKAERIAIMTEHAPNDPPTPEQLAIAESEAQAFLTETTKQKPAGQLNMKL